MTFLIHTHTRSYHLQAASEKDTLNWLKARHPSLPRLILVHNAEAEISTLQWSSGQPEWVAITFNKKLQILRV